MSPVRLTTLLHPAFEHIVVHAVFRDLGDSPQGGEPRQVVLHAPVAYLHLLRYHVPAELPTLVASQELVYVHPLCWSSHFT